MTAYWNFLVAQTPLSPEQTFLFLVFGLGLFLGIGWAVDRVVGRGYQRFVAELKAQSEAEWYASQVRYLAKARAQAISHDRTIGVIYEGLDDQIRRRQLNAALSLPRRIQ